ncbi:hypothetical protein KC951_00400 [Candidatus Saccharibacteria bacterium]|nr:hypothetical protein [Candidatus Saccharibacteria bacterium]
MASAHETGKDIILEAATFYVGSTLFDLASLDDTTHRSRQVQNGEVVDVPTDAETVLYLHIDSPLAPSQLSRQGRRELDFTLGLIIGAALERGETLPEEMNEAVQGIVDRSRSNG